MAFRIEHGKVSTVGKAASAAGAAERQREASRIAAAKEQAEVDKKFQVEMLKFREGLDLQAAQRAEQFELQKMELRSQQETEHELMRQDAFFQKDLAKELKEAEEMDNKVAAIDKAVKNGVISEDDGAMAKLRLQLDITPKIGGGDDELSFIRAMMQEGRTPGSDVGLTPEEVGAEATGEPYERAKVRPTEEAITAFTNPYYAAQKGFLWKTKKMVANIPVMRQKLEESLASPDIDNESKVQLIDILRNGTDRTIEKAWKKMYGEK